MERQAPEDRGGGSSAPATHARPAACLRGLVDLCLRRAHPRRPRGGDPDRNRPRRHGSHVVAHLDHRSVRQLPPPVERRGLLLHHGRPPLGQVLHGRLARQAPGHLDHRRGVVRGVGGSRLYRLPVPAELRQPVDQHPSQGRDQLDRRRGHIQRDQFRADAHVAHRPAAPRGGAAGGRTCPFGAAAGRRASIRPARPTFG